MYYAGVGILALIILLIINYDALKKPTFGEAIRSHSAYRSFLFCVMSYYITDIIWGLLYTPETVFFCYIDTVFYFSAMTLSIFFWTRYVVSYIGEEKRFFSILKYAGIFFLIFSFAIILLNFFTQILFWFDSKGIYYPGRARYISLSMQIILFFATSIYMAAKAIHAEGLRKRRYTTIWVSGMTMSFCIILQRIFVFLPFYSIGFIIATCLIHTFVLEDEKEARREELEKILQTEEIQEEELGKARKMAFTDPLTSVKSKNAYIEDVCKIEKRIKDGVLKDFGIVVFDINGLKTINDTKGHEEGDRLIKEACNLICHEFKRSPIYRIGGDEFVAFLTGEDFRNHELLLENFNLRIEKNNVEGKLTIACGYEDLNGSSEKSFLKIFENADRKMYERKKELKGRV